MPFPVGWADAMRRSVIGTVGKLVGDGHEAIARILHPFSMEQPNDARVGWVEVARLNGREVDLRSCSFFDATGVWYASDRTSEVWDKRPTEGGFGKPDQGTVARILSRHTSTPDSVVFGFWNGNYSTDRIPGTDVQVGDLNYRGVYGTLDAVPDVATLLTDIEPDYLFKTPPNVWWPDDGAWFVHSNIDLPSTYVAGTQALIDELVANDDLEAVQVSPETALGDAYAT